MAGPEQRVLAVVRDSGLLTAERTTVVLLSGGRDSVCLLDAAIAILGPGSVRALHVNYGLRDAAGGDERHCRELCSSLGVHLDVVVAPPRPARGNVQAWARELRYREGGRLAAEAGGVMATGHTSSDQAETVLYRLAAAPGRRALLGMAPRRGLVVRPLLRLSRSDTTAYCRARKLTWREDASNADARFARTRVRVDLLDALRAVHPAAEANLVRTADLLRDEAEVLEGLLDATLDGRTSLDRSELEALGPALGRLVLARLAEQAAGRPVPGVGARLDDVLALGGAGGSASIDIGEGMRAVARYGRLGIEAATPRSPVPREAALALPGRLRFGTWLVSGERASASVTRSLRAGPLGGQGWGGALSADQPERAAALDAALLGDRVAVRGWRTGDRMAPLGLGGSRALSDLFTDRAVPRAERQTVPVIEARGQIAWVPGVALSRDFALSPATRDAICLRARPLGEH